MNWKSIRLELGCTADFPNGSASRAYLLRLPLTADGRIDASALESKPEQATVRRFWPSEPDLSGHVRRVGEEWGCVMDRGFDRPVIFSRFGSIPISEGTTLMLRGQQGEPLPFRVAKLSTLN